MSARRTLPEGRLERAVHLARIGAGTGLGIVAGKSTEKLAEQATAVLASTRGLAAKVGQMASSVEGLLPESLEVPLAHAMARLRDHTEISPYAEVVAVIEKELRAPTSTLFREFDPVPIASASLVKCTARCWRTVDRLPLRCSIRGSNGRWKTISPTFV